jgi:hypothetical protein
MALGTVRVQIGTRTIFKACTGIAWLGKNRQTAGRTR